MFRIADDHSSVFVRLLTNNAAETFELQAREERALVVGSTAMADFHVGGPGVAPVQFHLERYDSAVWLIPGYAVRELFLNAAHVNGPVPLDKHNVLEFAAVHLVITIHDAQAFAASGESTTPRRDSRREFPASYSLELPSDAQATRQAMVPVVSRAAASEMPTAVHAPFVPTAEKPGASTSPEAIGLTTQRYLLPEAAGHQPPEPAFTPHRTQIIPPYRPAPTAPWHEEEVTLVTGSPEPRGGVRDGSKAPAESVQLVRLSNAPRPQPVPPRPTPRTTTGHSPLATRDEEYEPEQQPLPIPAVPNEAPLPSSPANSSEPATQAVREAEADTDDALVRLPPLARLGVLAQTRPLLVISTASLGALTLMGALLAAERLVHCCHTTTNSHSPLVVSATLSSLRPSSTAPAIQSAEVSGSAPVGTPAPIELSTAPASNQLATAPAAQRARSLQRRATETACTQAAAAPPRDRSIY